MHINPTSTISCQVLGFASKGQFSDYC